DATLSHLRIDFGHQLEARDRAELLGFRSSDSKRARLMNPGIQQPGSGCDEDLVFAGFEHIESLFVRIRTMEDRPETCATGTLDCLSRLGMTGQPDTCLAGRFPDRLRLLLRIQQLLGATGRKALVAGHEKLDGVAT